ncbi:MAG TPA: glycosyltransferase, partial [Longimicrobiaceae bacterium]|nr:glycosyltransferase [Longimicrobiaceae bacterium]
MDGVLRHDQRELIARLTSGRLRSLLAATSLATYASPGGNDPRGEREYAMLCILHGYLLEGSGSNLWTRAIIQSLCRQGETVHLVCQENHPERYDFITEARLYHADGSTEVLHRKEIPHSGCCILHKPRLGRTLPVYVWDEYEEFERVAPMIELTDAEIEEYLERNVLALELIVREEGITALHANHAVLMSVVAQRVGAATGVPFTIMPHGSAIEYAVKKDERFLRYATDAFTAAGRIFVIGEEMRQRVRAVFTEVPDLEAKLTELHLGVDTALFEPIPRNARRENIASLLNSISGVPRGRSSEQERTLREGLSGDLTQAELRELFAATSDYDPKRPDADLQAKLGSVEWEREDTLLFVGRLIAAKGVQTILAALPLILERRPRLRLLVVGHGPLREPMEAFLWALERGERMLAKNIAAWGRTLEGAVEERGPPELTGVRLFFDSLERRGELDAYFDAARRHLRSDCVIFTGYLEHAQLRYLFPCCDVAVFPSIVREAGPLVFLEAMASGCFPLGTDFGGMAASIDTAAEVLPAEEVRWMKLSPEP